MTTSTTIDAIGQPQHTHTRRNRRIRWQVPVFIAIAYGTAWLPALGRLDNPSAALVLPIGPSLAALVVVGWLYRWTGLRALLRSTVDVRIGRWWWGAVIPLPVAATTAVVTVLAGAAPPAGTDVASALASFAVLPLTMIVGGPLGEEFGWRGYLLPHLLRRHAPITATLILLPFWLGFHLINSGDFGPPPNNVPILRVTAEPYPINPFRWQAIVETPDFYQLAIVDTFNDTVVTNEHSDIFYKPAETATTLAAKQSWLGHIYLDWSRIPLVTQSDTDPTTGLTVVTFDDLRFMYDAYFLHGREDPPLSGAVTVNAAHRVTRMEMDGRIQR